MRLRVEYFDQNESFTHLLPRAGAVAAKLRSADSPHVWYLLKLDEPVSYEGTGYSHFLVASRWARQSIGLLQATSVFILLVPKDSTVEDGFSQKQYMHVAWGMARVECKFLKRLWG